MTCCSELKRSAVIILTFNIFCVISQNAHELAYVLGCFDNGTTEVQLEYDSEEIFYVDFKKETVEYTAPVFSKYDPSEIFDSMKIYKDAKKNMKACLELVPLIAAFTGYPPEVTDAPESVLYTAEEVEVGVENRLICFVDHFYPPFTKISWTKNGNLLTKGVSLSRYYPNKDSTFHQFSTLTFTPSETDFYSCTVEHLALDEPKTRIWEPKFVRQSIGLDVFCAVGLSLGLLGIAVGTFLFAKSLTRK